MRFLRSRFGGLYVFGVIFITTSVLLRTVLGTHSLANIDCAPWTLCKVFFVGMLFDVVTYFYFVTPVAIFLLFASDRVYRSRAARWLMIGLYFIALFAIVFDAAAEWLFFDEFGARYNFVSVDYIVYTHQFAQTLLESCPVAIVLGGVLFATAVIFGFTRGLVLKTFESISSFRQRLVPGMVYLTVPVISLFAIHPSLAEVSRNHYNNELTKNGVYSFLSAVKFNIMDYDRDYVTVDSKQACARLRGMMKADGAVFVGEGPMDLTHDVTASGGERKCNVVITVIESLSANFMGEFGNPGKLTPNLDRLSHESLFFSNLYAIGTRTDRGLEAVVLSVPPTPGRCIIKKPLKDNPYSLGDIFRARGYDTRFIVTGDGTFDNMNEFFERSGFSAMDVKCFSKGDVTFANVWGACDGDLFHKAVKEGDKSFAAGRPFCTVLMTCSNHQPYTYPVNAGIAEGLGRVGSVRYTDHAIGQFLAEARKRPWFDNTIFVFVADHCAYSAGRAEMTASAYHIPAFIYSPALVKPGRVEAVTSQIDLTPTVLGLMNFSYRSRFFGRDVLKGGEGCAFLGDFETLALLKGGRLTMLMPEKRSKTLAVSADGSESDALTDPALLQDAVAWFQSASSFVRDQLEAVEPPVHFTANW